MKVKILTVDDDMVVLATIKNMIKSDFDDKPVEPVMDTAHNKEEAMKKFEESLRAKDYYDLVFLDLSIDEHHDGFDLIPVFKTHSPKTHVVIVTGSPHIRLLKKAKESGADGFVMKPVSSIVYKLNDIVCRTAKLKKLEEEFKEVAYDEDRY